MSIAVKTDTGWQVLGVGESSGGGATKWGDWTIVDAPDEQNTWSAPDSQGRIWKYVEFNKAGDYTINLTGGMYWVLTVGGGDWGATTAEPWGQPGLVNEGYWEFDGGTTPIKVGAKSSTQNNKTILGEPSSIGGYGTQGFVTWGAGHTGRGGVFDQDGTGYKSFITGSEQEYATGYTPGLDRPGRGGWRAGEVPNDGCVIIATVDEDKTDYYPPGALPGVGGWATITGIDGTAGTRYQYGDWVAYEWTADGELTTSGGLVDVFMISGGGAGVMAGDSVDSGNGGRVVSGIETVEANNAVKVGAAGTYGNNAKAQGRSSQLGKLTTGPAGTGGWTSASNATSLADATDEPWYSSIVGEERDYGSSAYWLSHAAGTPARPNRGDGGWTNSRAAGDGVVICRVPKAHAYLGALPAGWVDA